jgi:hypothetical protein
MMAGVTYAGLMRFLRPIGTLPLDVAFWIAVALVYGSCLRTLYLGDAHIYWEASHLGYPTSAVVGFVYPPPAYLVMAVLGQLPYVVFYAGWLALLMAAMHWLLGPVLFMLAITPGFLGWHYLASGNVGALIAVGIVLGFSRPSWQAIPLLTKVTTGVGLLWWVTRREWRPLAVAVGFTGALCLVSFVIAPQLWPQWFEAIRLNMAASPADEPFTITNVPFLVRAPIAAAMVIGAAWRNQRWVVPIAATYAIGWIGDTSLMVALGSVRLLRESGALRIPFDPLRLARPVPPDRARPERGVVGVGDVLPHHVDGPVRAEGRGGPHLVA